jgi:hypothetical protein
LAVVLGICVVGVILSVLQGILRYLAGAGLDIGILYVGIIQDLHNLLAQFELVPIRMSETQKHEPKASINSLVLMKQASLIIACCLHPTFSLLLS